MKRAYSITAAIVALDQGHWPNWFRLFSSIAAIRTGKAGS